MADDTRPQTKRMRLRYAGVCRSCRTPVAAGEWAEYDRASRTIRCPACTAGPDPGPPAETAAPGPARAEPSRHSTAEPPIDPPAEPIDPPAELGELGDPPVESGVAGASARREHERRAARRQQRVRDKHPRLGGLILAVTDEPSSTQVWATGAVGEEMLGKRLDTLTDRGVQVLHDRRIPGSRANIDHIVLSAAGVFVVDAKRYRGRRPRLRVQGGILRPRTETLLVGTRDCTKLVDGVLKQVERVRAALAPFDPLGEIPVRGVLCFLDADWPLIGGAFSIREVDVLRPEKLVERISTGTELAEPRIDQLHRLLATAFPLA
jgi:hypothetical protein